MSRKESNPPGSAILVAAAFEPGDGQPGFDRRFCPEVSEGRSHGWFWKQALIEIAERLGVGRGAPPDSDRPRAAGYDSLAGLFSSRLEVLALRVSPDYFQHLRHQLERIAPTRSVGLAVRGDG